MVKLLFLLLLSKEPLTKPRACKLAKNTRFFVLMCGIIGVITEHADNEPEYKAAAEVCAGLFSMQHRGQDAAGIMAYDSRLQTVHTHKGLGLVSQALNPKIVESLKGNVAIGHARYPTAGSAPSQEIQPFLTSYPLGIALAHNGNLTNFEKLRKEINAKRLLLSRSDSEVLLKLLSEELSASPRI